MDFLTKEAIEILHYILKIIWQKKLMLSKKAFQLKMDQKWGYYAF